MKRKRFDLVAIGTEVSLITGISVRAWYWDRDTRKAFSQRRSYLIEIPLDLGRAAKLFAESMGIAAQTIADYLLNPWRATLQYAYAGAPIG